MFSRGRLDSTGVLKSKWQVGGTRYEQQKITGNRIKNAFASLFARNNVAFA